MSRFLAKPVLTSGLHADEMEGTLGGVRYKVMISTLHVLPRLPTNAHALRDNLLLQHSEIACKWPKYHR